MSNSSHTNPTGAFGKERPRSRTQRSRNATRLIGWLSILDGWIERSHQRRQLANLDDRFLKDIGVTHADLADEIAKPFWR